MKSLRLYPVQLLLLSLVALVATFWQTAEKIFILKNPGAPLSCNINPIADCGTVLNHDLSSVFGVPNSMIGMVLFTMLFTFALAILFQKDRVSDTTKKLILLLALAALSFSVWFFAVSLYVIGKICIFCVAIWLATVPVFVRTMSEYAGDVFRGNNNKALVKHFQRNSINIIVFIYALGIVLYLFRFRDYYFA